MAAYRSKLQQERLALKCLAEALATDSPASEQTAQAWIKWAAGPGSPLLVKGIYAKNRFAELSDLFGQACADSSAPQPTARLSAFVSWAGATCGSFDEHPFLMAAARSWMAKSGCSAASAAIALPSEASLGGLSLAAQTKAWRQGGAMRILAKLSPAEGIKIASERPEAAGFLLDSVVAEVERSGSSSALTLLSALCSVSPKKNIDRAFLCLSLDSEHFPAAHDALTAHGASWTTQVPTRQGKESLFSRLFHYVSRKAQPAFMAKKELGAEKFWSLAHDFYRNGQSDILDRERQRNSRYLQPCSYFAQKALAVLGPHEDLPPSLGMLLLQDSTRMKGEPEGGSIAQAFSVLSDRIGSWPDHFRDPWLLPAFSCFEPGSPQDCESERSPQAWFSRARRSSLWRTQDAKSATPFERLCQCFAEHRFPLPWPSSSPKENFYPEAIRSLEKWEIMNATTPLAQPLSTSSKPPRL